MMDRADKWDDQWDCPGNCSQFDRENNPFLVETHLPTPIWQGRIVNLLEGKMFAGLHQRWRQNLQNDECSFLYIWGFV